MGLRLMSWADVVFVFVEPDVDTCQTVVFRNQTCNGDLETIQRCVEEPGQS